MLWVLAAQKTLIFENVTRENIPDNTVPYGSPIEGFRLQKQE
jgi:hypothetical protein